MSSATLPEVRKARIPVPEFEKEREWLSQHWPEYIGQWIVLDGDRLVGSGSDPVPIVTQARAEGVQIPFVKFVRDESEPFCGGWL